MPKPTPIMRSSSSSTVETGASNTGTPSETVSISSSATHTPTTAKVPTPTAAGTPTSSSSSKQSKHNIFSNDGSFLEKFQKERLKDMTDESLAAKTALKRKREAEDRLKSRGKKNTRKSVTPEPASAEDKANKNAYLEAVAEYSKSQSGLKDVGSGQQTYVK